jgi:uncharacterized coiled-coil protein SlyX
LILFAMKHKQGNIARWIPPWLVIACLVLVLGSAAAQAFMQATRPVPRKVPNNSASTSQSVQSHANGKSTRTATPAPGPQVTANPQEEDKKRGDTGATNTDSAVVIREPVPVSVIKDWADYLAIFSSFLLFIIGAVGVCFAVKTLDAINKQAAEMALQRAAMQDQLTTMQGQFGEMQKQAAEMEKQTRHLEISVSAAKTSADIAARVSIPTLVIDKFEQGYVGAANLEATLQFPNVNIVIKNYGQTPAFLRSWNIIFTCEELPLPPDYWHQPGYPEVRLPAAGIMLEKDVVQPSQSYTLPALPSWKRTEISLEDVRSIVDRKKHLWAYGFICYYDLFGSPLRRIKFCELALNFHDGWIGWTAGFSPQSYVGTEDYIFPNSTTRDEIDYQAISREKTGDEQPKKAN